MIKVAERLQRVEEYYFSKKLEEIRRKLSMKSHKLPTNERFLVELIASEFCSIINHSGEMAKIVIDELSRLET